MVNHTNLISGARTLTDHILSKNTDPIEESLSRSRLTGALKGLFTIGIPAGILLHDASTDEEKLLKIKAKLLNLETTELDKASPDYEAAIFARDFQKEIYSKIADYTQTALKIKNFTSIGLLLNFAGGFTLIAAQNPNTQLAGLVTSSLGLLLAAQGSFLNFTHWMIRGNYLDKSKQELAMQAANRLSIN